VLTQAAEIEDQSRAIAKLKDQIDFSNKEVLKHTQGIRSLFY